MSPLRKFARGKDCTVRLPGCGFDDGTTVLAHLPHHRKGWAIKAPDWHGVHACDHCHGVIDGRYKVDLTGIDLGMELLRALGETQERVIQAGLVVVQGHAVTEMEAAQWEF